MLQSSCDRRAWSSDTETGMFHAYKHRQSNRGFEEHYYGHTIGLHNRRQAVEAVDGSK